MAGGTHFSSAELGIVITILELEVRRLTARMDQYDEHGTVTKADSLEYQLDRLDMILGKLRLVRQDALQWERAHPEHRLRAVEKASKTAAQAVQKARALLAEESEGTD